MLRKRIVTLFIISLVLLMAGSILPVGAVNEERTGIIVGFKDKPTATDIEFLKSQGAVIKYTYSIIPAVAVDIPSQAFEKITEICRSRPTNAPFCKTISYIEPDAEVHILGKPTPVQPAQVLPWGIDKVDADFVWPANTGAGTKIAVLDTGIDPTHPDLDANVKGGVTYIIGTKSYKDDNGHGTHVAGIIAAENNGIGVVGVAPSASLYAVKVLDRSGSGSLSTVIAGIDWSVVNGMQIITMSLGTSADFQSLHDAVDNAYNRGIVIVAAAGNDKGGKINYPAAYSSVIAVTATDINNNLASFSNVGPEAEIAAPGVSIYSTYKGGSYATLSGTSMATPHVTGTVGLMLATHIPLEYDLNGNGEWDPAEVREKLHKTTVDLGTSGWDPYYGYGLVNAYNAVS